MIKQLYKRYRKRAENKGIPFTLTPKEFGVLVSQNCEYCNAPPSNLFKYGNREMAYNGIDRLDSGLGYTFKNPANVVPCCRFCNTLKSSMRPDTWFDFLSGIIRRNGGQVPDGYKAYKDPERPSKAVNFWKMRGR